MDISERIYVSIDLETTGLSPESDEIIEVGAIKFQNGRQIDVFQTLVNPYRTIPYNITKLCNITQSEVDGAPDFAEIAAALTVFLDGCSPVGHNVSFDLNFLAAKGIHPTAPACDTLDMAKLLLPSLTERNLGAVAAHLQIPHPAAHRALADAEVAGEIFHILLNRLLEMEPEILSELVRLTARKPGWMGQFMQDVADSRKINPLMAESGFEKATFASLSPKKTARLTPNPQIAPLDIDALSHLFDSDGPLSKAFPSYEQRPEQLQMMQSVAQAFNHNQHLIVEAGTGTGKSLAYLLPAIAFAGKNNVPVVISTNTINLQEQLMFKDIPTLLAALKNDAPDINVVQLKGRSNYLCLRRWQTLRKSESSGMEMAQLLARIQVWLPKTQTGDRSELNPDSWELRFWPRVSAQAYDCFGRRCPYFQRNLCFLHRARNQAESAHIIVTNHALLLSEIASGAQILPEYSRLILDEAHHFEDVATDQMGSRLHEEDIVKHIDEIIKEIDGQQSGFLPQFAYFTRNSGVEPAKLAEIEKYIHSLAIGAKKTRARISDFFSSLGYLLQNYGEGQGEYDLNLRITGAMRAQPAWSDIEIHCENLTMGLADITKALSKINAGIEDLPVSESLKFEAFTLLNVNEEIRQQLDSLVFYPAENSIHWLSLGRKHNIIGLHMAPLDVGQHLKDSFYSQMDTLILTGATLSTGGNFNYLKSRLGMEISEEILLGNSFDYENSTLIYLATDIPEPGRAGYQKAVAQTLIDLCRTTKGRCLVLFTSHAALRTIKSKIQGPLAADDILVLGQGLDGSPNKLLNTLKSNPRTVLLGAASFWEGVDVVGEALSVLVMVRLPFAVPSDPIFAARSETFDDPFNEYSLPKTAFKFKQGFGRLIRSKDDRGVMAVLDSRLSARNYGEVFLNSLPPCQIEKGPARNLTASARKWLDKNHQD